jgi:eukaryotic-like serine/threonine-protein kinase
MIGQTISHYRVVEKLGGGGMGVVYKAEDTRLRRFVALKFLPSEMAGDASALERFRREAEAASALNHPNICVVHDIDEENGEHFIAMEFLDGKTLKHCIEGKALTVERFLDWGVQIAEGLGAAHAQGIVHRDIKPANIFITKHGHAKVLDFGLAKLATAAENKAQGAQPTVTMEEFLTSPGATVGTVAYMSPEQARGEDLDPRSDLFSFGSVLYEMGTGRTPFMGNTPAVIFEAILNKAPVSPTSLNRALPQELERVISKALEKDRDVRYQSAAELRADLKRFRRDTTSGQSLVFLPGATTPKRQATVYVGAALAIVALLALGVFLFLDRSRSPLVPPSEWVQLTDFVDSAISPALSPDGRMLAFLRGTSTFTSKGEVYLKLLPAGQPVQLTHDGAAKMSPVFTPDGSQVAYTVPGHWDTWIVPTLGGEARLMLPNGSGLTWMDEHRMLFSEIKTGRHMVIVTSKENRSEERDVYFPPGDASMAHRSFASPDGKWALVVWMDTIGGWQPCTLAPLSGAGKARIAGPANAQCTSAGWSPDGRWMYFSAKVGGAGGFHTWRQRFPDGKPEQITAGISEEEGIAISPDGRSLVTSVGTIQSSMWVHNRDGDHQVTSEGEGFLSQMDASSSRGAFSPDGKRVYYLGRSQNSKTVEIRSTEVSSARSEVIVSGVSEAGFDLSNDGRTIVYSAPGVGGKAAIWIEQVDHRLPPREIQSTENQFGPVFAPDGRIFFMSTEGGKAFLNQMNADGTGQRRVTTDPVVQMQTISPDGQWIVTQVAYPGEDPPRGIAAIPTLPGREPVRLCQGVCGVRWALNAKAIFFTKIASAHPGTSLWTTYIIPLPAGKMFPKLPSLGVASETDILAIPGTKRVEGYLIPGQDEASYAFSRDVVHRNLFKIPLK